MQSQQILQKLSAKKSSDQSEQKSQSIIRSAVAQISYVVSFGRTAAWYLFNRNITHLLSLNWFKKGEICEGIPHVPAKTVFGQTQFTKQEIDKYITAALKKGVATYWAGPVHPVVFVQSNTARLALVREGSIGVIEKETADLLFWMTGGNRLLQNFILYHPLESKIHKQIRHFLLSQFHMGAKYKLPIVTETTEKFLEKYQQMPGKKDFSLKEFITLMVLNISSHLLGLTNYTMDERYLVDEQYREDLAKVAKYGTAGPADPLFEKRFYDIFVEIFKNNFDVIEKDNLIYKIFEAIQKDFPQDFQEFTKMDEKTRYTIAMLFTTTAFGAMIHSTATTLDWAVAELLQKPEKIAEFTRLVEQCTEVADIDQFNEDGIFFPITQFVLENVIHHPPFAFEFFYCRKSFSATFTETSSEGVTASTVINVPDRSFILVNYLECNKTFNYKKSHQTIENFMDDPEVASFGGSVTSKESGNKKSRRCPAALTSLIEQAIFFVMLFKHFKLQVTETISTDYSVEEIPLHVRTNQGRIRLVPLKNLARSAVSAMGQFKIKEALEIKPDHPPRQTPNPS